MEEKSDIKFRMLKVENMMILIRTFEEQIGWGAPKIPDSNFRASEKYWVVV